MMHDFAKKKQKETPYRLTRYGVLWTRRESNPRPFGCEPNALPTELRAHEKAPNFKWGQMSYNTRSGKQRLLSQLSYEPIFKPKNRLGGAWYITPDCLRTAWAPNLSYRPCDDPVSVTLFGKFVKYFGQGQKASLSGCLAARKQQRWQRQRSGNPRRGT